MAETIATSKNEIICDANTRIAKDLMTKSRQQKKHFLNSKNTKKDWKSYNYTEQRTRKENGSHDRYASYAFSRSNIFQHKTNLCQVK